MNRRKKRRKLPLDIKIGILVLLSTAGIAYHFKTVKEGKSKICMYTISDDKAFDDLEILKGNNIINDSSNIYVIGTLAKEKGKCKYLILNENKEACIASLDSRYLKKISGSEIDVGNSNEFIDDINVLTVNNEDGIVFRDDNLDGKDTSDYKSSLLVTDELLQKEGILYNQAITVDNDKINFSYVANYYLKEYEDKYKKIYKVKTPDKIGLNVRSTPSNISSDNIITILDENSILYYIKDISEVNSNEVNWAYVGYIQNSEIKYGYIAAKQYNNGVLRDFIEEIKDKNKISMYNEMFNPLSPQSIEKNTYISKQTEIENKKLNQKVYNNAKNNIYANKVCKKVDLSILKDYHGNLNVRSNPGINEDVIATISDKDIVYLDYDYQIYENDNISFVKIYLPNGKEGYVDNIYLKDMMQEEALDTNLISNEITVNNKVYKGVYGVDINNCTSFDSFNKILNNGVKTKSYPNNEIKHIIPNYFIFKIGATNYGYYNNFQINEDTSTYADNVRQMMNKCNEEKIPFGLYYFSQATTKKEALYEVRAMAPFIDYIKETNNTMFRLPLILDIEAFDGYRLTKNSKEKNTNILNYEMELIREYFPGIEPMIYTESNTLTNVISYDNLKDDNKDELFTVVCNDTHVDRYNNLGIPFDKMKIMQTSISNTGCDVDFLDEDYYKEITKKQF